ncbi:MAG: DUF962 domain-containing protein [Myxococcales bacterium]|nr:MAG: DUF962 domain-containing protein [Myxococcales bacterium]
MRVYPHGVDDYGHFHKNKTNLIMHLLVVPLFVVGIVYALLAAMQGRWLAAVLALLLPLVSIAVQGAGHKKEPNPPLPFDGPGDFVKRIFSEQFYKFPKFVLSGEWLRAVRASR